LDQGVSHQFRETNESGWSDISVARACCEPYGVKES